MNGNFQADARGFTLHFEVSWRSIGAVVKALLAAGATISLLHAAGGQYLLIPFGG